MQAQRSFINKIITKYSQILRLDLDYFVKGGLWISLSTFITLVGGLFLSSLFAKTWPKDVFGQFSFLVTCIGFLSITTAPGLSQVVIQEVAKGKEGIYKIGTNLAFKYSLLGALILLLGAIYFFIRSNLNLSLAFLVSGLAFPFSNGLILYLAYLNGRKDFKKFAFFSTIAQYASIIATIFALLKFSSLVMVALFSAWSTALINIIFTLITLKKIKNSKIDSKSISFSHHLNFLNGLSFFSDYADKFLVAFFLGFNSNAIYAFATLLPNQLHNFFKLFLNLGQPKIAQLNNLQLKQALFKKSLQLEILILILVLVYLAIAPFLFSILYPNYKESALFYSQLFSLSLLYYPANLYGLGILKQQSASPIYRISVLYNLFNIILVIILIPLLGILGAIVSKLISRFILIAVSVYTLDKLVK